MKISVSIHGYIEIDIFLAKSIGCDFSELARVVTTDNNVYLN